MQYALANVDAVLAKAGMGRNHVICLRFFTHGDEAWLLHLDI